MKIDTQVPGQRPSDSARTAGNTAPSAPVRAESAVSEPARAALALRQGELVSVRVLELVEPVAANRAGTAPDADLRQAAAANPRALAAYGSPSGVQRENFMRVEVAGKELMARTPAYAKPGDVFEARVALKSGEVQLVPVRAGDLPRRAAAANHLAQVQPDARSHAQTVPKLTQLADRIDQLVPRLPPDSPARNALVAVRTGAAEVVATLPAAADLAKPAVLTEAVTRSGVAFEAKTAALLAEAAPKAADPNGNNATPAAGRPNLDQVAFRPLVDGDLKGQLLRLQQKVRDAKQQLSELPSLRGELRALAESTLEDTGRAGRAMLAQVEVGQLSQSLGRDEALARFVDVPVQPDDRGRGLELSVRDDEAIQREERVREKLVKLRVDLGERGPLLVTLRVSMREDGSLAPTDTPISVAFTTRKVPFADALREALPTLVDRLTRQGFAVRSTDAVPGNVPETLSESAGANRGPVVDVRT